MRLESGEMTPVPPGWSLLPPGDAGLTRRVKASGPSWTVVERKGRKKFSHGVWAPAQNIEAAQRELDAERATPAYQKRLEAGRARRARAHEAYVVEFEGAVRDYLAFDAQYTALAKAMAEAITAHATPVGSGTVARTQRIPVQRRAEAAVIAWMRHQTTAYDDMSIPRQKGARREVRRALARRSKQLLGSYRRGDAVEMETCPLASLFLV